MNVIKKVYKTYIIPKIERFMFNRNRKKMKAKGQSKFWSFAGYDEKTKILEMTRRGEIRKYRYGVRIDAIKHFGNFKPVRY